MPPGTDPASGHSHTQIEEIYFVALHQMLQGLDEADREQAWQEVAEALSEFEDAEGFIGPCELLVGAATR